MIKKKVEKNLIKSVRYVSSASAMRNTSPDNAALAVLSERLANETSWYSVGGLWDGYLRNYCQAANE